MNRTMRSFIIKCVNFYGLAIAYAGLIVSFVPSVLCDPDWSSHLTYEQIYNSTNYAQIRHGARPYNIQHSPVAYNFNNNYFYTKRNRYNNDFEEDTKGNDLEYEEHDYKKKDNTGELLVGFAHDPFRYSIPEADYLKGVRTMDPKEYMDKSENRGKRGVVHLYNMMYCATGCEPLAYKGYGCYCGFLGAGRPTDGIDRCCKMHDQCYENIYCPFFTVYFQPYYWKCYRGEPLCALENHHTRHQFINGCAARLCECDRQFAMCVKRYPCPRRRALCFSSPVRLLQNLLMFR